MVGEGGYGRKVRQVGSVGPLVGQAGRKVTLSAVGRDGFEISWRCMETSGKRLGSQRPEAQERSDGEATEMRSRCKAGMGQVGEGRWMKGERSARRWKGDALELRYGDAMR